MISVFIHKGKDAAIYFKHNKLYNSHNECCWLQESS
jgi:hypothetical protein